MFINLNNLAFAIILILLLAESVATTIIVPGFVPLYEGMEQDMPLLSRVVLESPYFIWLLPVTVIIGLFANNKSTTNTALAVSIILGLAWVPIAIYGLYLPIFIMGSAVT